MALAKLLWRSVKIVLLIPKESNKRKFRLTNGILELSLVFAALVKSKERIECCILHIYIISDSRIDVSIQFLPWGRHKGLRIINAVPTVHCNNTKLRSFCVFPFSADQLSFDTSFKRLLLIIFLMLTMLQCVYSECELEQAF